MKAITGIAVVGAILLASSMLPLTVFREAQVSMETAGNFYRFCKNNGIKFLSPKELAFRMGVFAKADAFIKQENSKDNTYTLGHNKFSVLTEEEFEARYTNSKLAKLVETERSKENKFFVPLASVAQAGSIDWRLQNAVTPIKDMGSCIADWAFAATTPVESMWKISGRTLEVLSEQQLIDCSTAEGNVGCVGGWTDFAFKYLLKSGGQARSSDYPYKAKENNCVFKPQMAVAKIKGFTDVPKNDCKSVLTGLNSGPLSGAMNTNQIKYYSGGVFSSASCSTVINHIISIVGYGHDNTVNKDYWIVRPAYGTNWGELGYIRLDRNVQPDTGLCGICTACTAVTAA